MILDRAGAEGGVATLCLNKPERLNALSLSMIRDMSEAIAEAFPTVGHFFMLKWMKSIRRQTCMMIIPHT